MNNLLVQNDEYLEASSKICFKQCMGDISKPHLTVAEQVCLNRCIFKFKEANEFGQEALSYLRYKIDKSQK